MYTEDGREMAVSGHWLDGARQKRRDIGKTGEREEA